MDQVIEFLKIYYREIIEFTVLIVSVVICLVKKRPCVNQIDTIKQDVLGLLPSLINSVEVPGNGAQKKSTVMSLINKYVSHRYHIDLDLTFVESAIEDILSTPTKKGE